MHYKKSVVCVMLMSVTYFVCVCVSGGGPEWQTDTRREQGAKNKQTVEHATYVRHINKWRDVETSYVLTNEACMMIYTIITHLSPLPCTNRCSHHLCYLHIGSSHEQSIPADCIHFPKSQWWRINFLSLELEAADQLSVWWKGLSSISVALYSVRLVRLFKGADLKC